MKKYFYDPYNNEKTIKSLKELQVLSKDLGYTLGQLALAWVMWNKDVSTAITGARNLEQLNESVQALELYRKWTPELDQRINKILDTTPTAKRDFTRFVPGNPRRP
jgi:aryl-alcohol dehydrogenase-like predicted oxidoreductase